MSPPRPPVPSRRGRRLRYELLLALELLALTTFAFGRPVLDSFGRSPETFIARGAGEREIILFAVLVVALPALAVIVVSLATHVFGRQVRRLVHLALVMVLGGVAAWRLGQDITGWPATATKLIVGAVAAGLALGVLRLVVSPTRTFLRFAGITALIFPLQFLLVSPTASLIVGEPPSLDPEVTGAVAADLGDDPPPIVVVVFDAFPTLALLDSKGGIDRDVYPNFARLADTSTWYRNASTVSGLTLQAVPAILTGRYPDPSERPPRPDPENLFTLLGGSYDMHVEELLTTLCPDDLCQRGESAGIGRLLADAVDLWSAGAEREADHEGFSLPAVENERRYDAAARFISQYGHHVEGRPRLTFLHVLLPHNPYQFLPDGSRYEQVGDQPTGFYAFTWTEGVAVARQRFLLQAQLADRLLGHLLDEMDAAGTFDDALVVVTADHGESFIGGETWRAPSEGNVHSVVWTPLVMKEPGQSQGNVDDANVMAIDVVPTIAEVLGVELPWDVDGVSATEAAQRDQAVKQLVADDTYPLQPEGDEPMVTIDARAGFADMLASRMIAGTGRDAVWKRTRHGDLFGGDVADLTIGEAHDGTVEVVPIGLDDVDLDELLTLEVVGRTDDLEVGTVVAYALNGTIGAVTEVEPGASIDGDLVHGLLPPRLFVEGENDLTAYVVEGAPREETLWPLTLAP
jgi:hypothetical protein